MKKSLLFRSVSLPKALLVACLFFGLANALQAQKRVRNVYSKPGAVNLTIPAGAANISVTIIGGGGSGSVMIGGGGGGGGAFVKTSYPTLQYSSGMSIVVGAGGSFGKNGGESSTRYYSVTKRANGGEGALNNIAGASGGVASGGQTNNNGGDGGDGDGHAIQPQLHLAGG
ncbi:MAG: glycine-rich domain-containing protein, partial [Bacteroidia bacterium]